MTVLTKRETWALARDPKATRRSSDLTPEEQANVRAALRVLRVRFGTYAKLAAAMNAKTRAITKAMDRRSHPSAGLALRAARLAGVPLEDVLSGAWPLAGTCPMCGRP